MTTPSAADTRELIILAERMGIPVDEAMRQLAQVIADVEPRVGEPAVVRLAIEEPAVDEPAAVEPAVAEPAVVPPVAPVAASVARV